MIGFTCSTFDLLHAGHIKMLQYAASRCDELWVGLQTQIKDRPKKNKPIQSVLERYIQLEALDFVKKIIPYEDETDLMNLLVTLPIPHVRFVGEEYWVQQFTGKSLYRERDGGEAFRYIEYVPREHGWSTSGLRQRIIDTYNLSITPQQEPPPYDDELA